jgi:Glycosyl transferase family 2
VATQANAAVTTSSTCISLPRIAGFRAATGDIIVTLDADGSTDSAEMPLFVSCLAGGADFVKGSRFVQGGGTDDMGSVRRAGNWVL